MTKSQIVSCALVLMLTAPVASGAQAADTLTQPEHALTPGLVVTVAAATVCVAGYASAYRLLNPVTSVYKRAIVAAYGYAKRLPTSYQLDHLVSLELGGATGTLNLWPEPWSTAHAKDSTENAVHREVCAGRMKLPLAQYRMAHNWRGEYLRLLHPVAAK